jgi:hypothetical protein
MENSTGIATVKEEEAIEEEKILVPPLNPCEDSELFRYR